MKSEPNKKADPLDEEDLDMDRSTTVSSNTYCKQKNSPEHFEPDGTMLDLPTPKTSTFPPPNDQRDNMYTHVRVLVVDDESDLCTLLEMGLGRIGGVVVTTAQSIQEALKLLKQCTYDLVLTDMRLPDGEGLQIVETVNKQYPQTHIAVVTAYGNVDNAVSAMRTGAFDYLPKPVGISQLRSLVYKTIQRNREKEQLYEQLTADIAAKLQWPPLSIDSQDCTTREAVSSPKAVQRLRGKSDVIEQVRQTIKKIAPTQATIYIQGESGTGKEQAARMIHELSHRAEAPFVPVNCGAIPEQLMESEFFGYKRGAFTGADRDHVGFFQQAHGGTLFLDEVADLPLSMQVKLLRAIQEKAVRRLGNTKEEMADVRIITATHKNLLYLVRCGLFRQDLYYRLHVIPLNMPSLRDIASDIPELVSVILKKHQADHYKITDSCMASLTSYSYPGNVRELENMLERALIFCTDERIQSEDLAISKEHDNSSGEDDLLTYLDRAELTFITNALRHCGSDISHTSQVLGISEQSLQHRMERLGILTTNVH